jgi:hypothetical protein
MPRPRAHRTTVRLTGITLRQQGTHDSLCAYYSAAMLLCALRPEFEDHFDAPNVAADPLYGNLPRRTQSLDRAVSEWIASGVSLDRLCRALNAACARGGVRTTFHRRHCNRVDGNFELLCAQIDRGLPCVLGWESRELGNHTSLVVGYERYRGSSSRWLRLLDPIRVQEALEWGQLKRLATERLDLIYCTAHAGVRPDKITTCRTASGAILSRLTRIERWHPASVRYEKIGAAVANR